MREFAPEPEGIRPSEAAPFFAAMKHPTYEELPHETLCWLLEHRDEMNIVRMRQQYGSEI